MESQIDILRSYHEDWSWRKILWGMAQQLLEICRQRLLIWFSSSAYLIPPQKNRRDIAPWIVVFIQFTFLWVVLHFSVVVWEKGLEVSIPSQVEIIETPSCIVYVILVLWHKKRLKSRVVSEIHITNFMIKEFKYFITHQCLLMNISYILYECK